MIPAPESGRRGRAENSTIPWHAKSIEQRPLPQYLKCYPSLPGCDASLDASNELLPKCEAECRCEDQAVATTWRHQPQNIKRRHSPARPALLAAKLVGANNSSKSCMQDQNTWKRTLPAHQYPLYCFAIVLCKSCTGGRMVSQDRSW